MPMLLRTVVLGVTVSMFTLPVSAQLESDGSWAVPLPPPPGPYVSSRQWLEPKPVAQRNNSGMPFFNNMPMAPGRYMPPAQVPPRWWYGPSGR